MKNLNDIAKSLYDVGWRCEDLKDLMEEYGFTFEQAFDICSELELLERYDIEIKPKIQPMIIDALFESTNDIKPEMNILKIVMNWSCIRIIYKECSQGLKTTLNNIENALDRIGFIYLRGYYEDIKKDISKDYDAHIAGVDGDYVVDCYYDSNNHISTFFIQLNR